MPPPGPSTFQARHCTPGMRFPVPPTRMCSEPGIGSASPSDQAWHWGPRGQEKGVEVGPLGAERGRQAPRAIRHSVHSCKAVPPLLRPQWPLKSQHCCCKQDTTTCRYKRNPKLGGNPHLVGEDERGPSAIICPPLSPLAGRKDDDACAQQDGRQRPGRARGKLFARGLKKQDENYNSISNGASSSLTHLLPNSAHSP